MSGPALIEAIVRPPLGWVAAALWGAAWGSFFGLAVWRIGRVVVEEETEAEALPDDEPWLSALRRHLSWVRRALASLDRPRRSRCPACQTTLRAVDNVPLVSFFLLGRRCRGCGAPISWRYPLVEAAGVALALAVYWRFVAAAPAPVGAQALRFLVYFGFAGTLLVAACIDGETGFLPDAVTWPAIPLAFLLGRALPDVTWLSALLGAVIGYGSFRLLDLLWILLRGRSGMAAGDAKLMAVIGAMLGWRALPWTLAVASVVGTAVLLPVVIARRRRGERDAAQQAVPFGPFLAAGALAHLLLAPVMERLLWALLAE